MRTGISIVVSPSDRLCLEGMISDRNTLQKHVWQRPIVQLTVDGFGTHAILREAGVAKTAVWRWQERFCARASTGCSATRRGPREIRRWVRTSPRRQSS